MLESIPEEELGSLRRGLRGLFGVATGIHAGVLVICIVRLLQTTEDAPHVYALCTARMVGQADDGLTAVATYAGTCPDTRLLAWTTGVESGVQEPRVRGTRLATRVDEANGFGLLAAVFAWAASWNSFFCVRTHQEDALERLRQPCELRWFENALTTPLQTVLVAALGYPLEYAHVRADLVDVDEVLPRGLVIGPTAPFATELSIGRRVLGKAPDAWLIVTQDKRVTIAWGVCWGAVTALQATVWVVLLEQVSGLEGGCLTGASWVSPLRMYGSIAYVQLGKKKNESL